MLKEDDLSAGNGRIFNPRGGGGSQEAQFERALRPKTLDDYIGQDKIRERLDIFIKAAKKRTEPLDHTLIFGPPGLGKTTLANIIANELEVEMQHTSGPILEKKGDLAAILTNLKPHDVLFVDEIHRLSPVVEEILYPAMEDFELDLLIGEGPAARSYKIPIPPFTLIGATTRAGMLTTPLRDRFGIVARLEFYSDEDLAIIIKRSAKLLEMDLPDDAATEIAKRSRGTPRIANRLLRRVRDISEILHESKLNVEIADKALKMLDVDELGLDMLDHKYLLAIIEKFGGGPVGVDNLATVLGESGDTIEDVIEPYLIQQGFVQRTPRGRVALKMAYDHFKIPMTKRDKLRASLFPELGEDKEEGKNGGPGGELF